MNNYYVKAALYLYPDLTRLIASKEKLILKKALGSRCNFSSALDQYEKIINIILQKGALEELKNKIEEALAKLTPAQVAYIKMTCFKTDIRDINETRKEYSKKAEKHIDEVAKIFESIGCDNLWFETECRKIDQLRGCVNRTIKYGSPSKPCSNKTRRFYVCQSTK